MCIVNLWYRLMTCERFELSCTKRLLLRQMCLPVPPTGHDLGSRIRTDKTLLLRQVCMPFHHSQVRLKRLELLLCYQNRSLNPVRLPIPPQAHFNLSYSAPFGAIIIDSFFFLPAFYVELPRKRIELLSPV